MGRFPGSEGFILRVKEPSFLRAEPSLVDVPNKPAHAHGVRRCTGPGTYPAGVQEAMYTPTRGYWEAYTMVRGT